MKIKVYITHPLTVRKINDWLKQNRLWLFYRVRSVRRSYDRSHVYELDELDEETGHWWALCQKNSLREIIRQLEFYLSYPRPK